MLESCIVNKGKNLLAFSVACRDMELFRGSSLFVGMIGLNSDSFNL